MIKCGTDKSNNALDMGHVINSLTYLKQIIIMPKAALNEYKKYAYHVIFTNKCDFFF
jgi:hypothetical protein